MNTIGGKVWDPSRLAHEGSDFDSFFFASAETTHRRLNDPRDPSI